MSTRSPRLGSILGRVIVALVVVGACVVLPAVFLLSEPQAGLFLQQLLSGQIQPALATARTLGATILLAGPGTIVPGPNDGPAEALLLTRQYPVARGGNTKEVRLVSVNTTTHKLMWQTDPLDPQLTDTPILANTDFVFIVNKQQLMAIHRSDGTPGWQATLADKLPLAQCDCIKLAGSQLVVLSDDGTLEVFDAATGKSQWQVRAKHDKPSGLYLLGQRAAFMDSDANNHGLLRAFDLQTSKETSVQPACAAAIGNRSDYGDWTTPLYISPKGTDFLIWIGACMQRWDANSLKMVWSGSFPDNFVFGSGALDVVFSDNTIYMANGSAVLAFDLAQGASRVAITDPDYALSVLTTHGGDVILQAVRQRGTARYEIWAMNGASGQPHWKYTIGENAPLSAGAIIANNELEWTVHPGTDGLRVLQYQSGSNRKNYTLLTDDLNWDTGQTAGQKVTPLNLNTIILTAPNWMIWKNDTLWMEMNDELQQFDAGQNKIVFQWP